MRNVKTRVYIDGFNLYGGLMDKRYMIPGDTSVYPLRKYLWLKPDDFVHSFLPKNYSIEEIKYFTAPIKGNPAKQQRQEAYIKALKTIGNLKVILGKHIPIGNKYSEKQTDVLMALHMFTDAQVANHQAIVLVSGDSDQVPTIRWIKDLNKGIKIHVVFPPFRVSKDLLKLADHHYKIKWKRLRKFQFPDPVKGEGFEVSKPKEWV